jgi:hypothetical protein
MHIVTGQLKDILNHPQPSKLYVNELAKGRITEVAEEQRLMYILKNGQTRSRPVVMENRPQKVYNCCL